MSNAIRYLNNSDIEVTDALFGRYVKLISETTIPYQWKILNDKVEGADPTRCIENFRIAAGEVDGEFFGAVFRDTDAYKWLEAVAYCIEAGSADAFIAHADETIELIGRAQQPDGYLNTYITITKPAKRWENLVEEHELYSAGHLIEAAVAYFRATGKTALLDIARKFADLICITFGDQEGQLKGYPGHQEIELALVKLYRITKEKRYLHCARFFIDERGKNPNYFLNEIKRNGEEFIFDEFKNYDLCYSQSHMPPVQQRAAEGHAVRALYMYSAMADIAHEFDDFGLKEACKAIWENITQKRMFITGGIGSSERLERFTVDYDLPNDRAYCETCASVGLMMFGQRMAALTKDASYYEAVERALHNTLLAGISMEGDRFFYVNPLEVWPDQCIRATSMSHVMPTRQKWFSVPCCPTNIARTLASVGQYIFAQDDTTLYINQFISAKAKTQISGSDVLIDLDASYMQDGSVRIAIQTAQPFLCKIRIPEYARSAQFIVDGVPVLPAVEDKYAYIDVNKDCDLTIQMDVPARFMSANIETREDIGKIALMKGPFVYCLEQTDNGGNLAALYVSPNTDVKENQPIRGLPGTLPALQYAGSRLVKTMPASDVLYGAPAFEKKTTDLTAVPYCLWCNREPGEMMVWQKVEFS